MIKNCLVFLIICLSAPLFFVKLGQSSLTSFDEAWYAGIAKNITKSGDIFNLTFNLKPYYDHPPLGFWLQAISFETLGINEFSARFPQALSGFISLFLVYFLGKELFGRMVGLTGALALLSAPWFLFRARSANLDSTLTMFFILTLFLAIKSTQNKFWLIPFSLSMGMLFSMKTLVPFAIIPALGVIFWGKVKMKDLIIPLIILILSIAPWVVSRLLQGDDFIKSYLWIGLPGVALQTNFLDNLRVTKDYLHFGIGKWFWPAVLASIFSPLTFQKSFLILSVFIITFFTPFIFSQRGQMWHLIPMYPFMVLSFLGFSYFILGKIFQNRVYASVLILLVTFYVAFMQLRQNWYQFINIDAFVSDEAILSQEANKHPYSPLYIDGDFIPTAVYYSDKEVSQIWFEALPDLFSSQKPVLIITKQERLDGAKIPKGSYRILASDRDKILVLKDL